MRALLIKCCGIKIKDLHKKLSAAFWLDSQILSTALAQILRLQTTVSNPNIYKINVLEHYMKVMERIKAVGFASVTEVTCRREDDTLRSTAGKVREN